MKSGLAISFFINVIFNKIYTFKKDMMCIITLKLKYKSMLYSNKQCKYCKIL